MEKCNLCPRLCNVDRSSQRYGFCKCNDKISIAKYMVHNWEEPSISGINGSGAVFFSGCNLRCVFCQNQTISRSSGEKEISKKELSDIFLELQDMGVHNINLVTPTHFVKQIIKALEISKNNLHIPVVYNTSGYESVETLKMLDGYIDIYLPDFKYYDSTLSSKYSSAPDYFEVAKKAIVEMYRQTGKYTEDSNHILKKGLIVRHLCLPNCRHDSVKVLEEIKNILPIQDIKLSLMSQFTPDFVSEKCPELRRKITTFEYNYVLNKAIELGFDGFFQQRESASAKYTPDF